MKILKKIQILKAIPFIVLIRKAIKKVNLLLSSFKNENIYNKLNKINIDNLNEQFIEVTDKYYSFYYDIIILNSKLHLELANKYINHNFDLLGSNWINLNQEQNNFSIDKKEFLEYFNYLNELSDSIPINYNYINWQKDGSSGYVWDRLQLSKKIVYGNISNAEIKFPWELGRLQHLIVFFNCWRITKDEKYIQEYCNQIIDFAISNPINFGTQWMNAMEASIRAINLIITFSLFITNKVNFDDKFISLFKKIVIIHYYFIKNNLEWGEGLRGNHYFSNIVGLILINLFLFKDTNNRDLINLVEVLKQEIDFQFEDDGGNFEKSMRYHYFMVEMLTTILFYLKEFNIITDLKKISKKIEKIYDFSFINLNNNFTCDNYGDCDSGYLIRFNTVYVLQNNKLKKNVNNYKELKILVEYLFPNYQINNFTIKSFNQFGLHKIRKRNYLINFYCGDYNIWSKGGHHHNDNLSFTLYYNNLPLFIDCGSYLYTSSPNYRNEFRSIKKHNTLQLNGFEQNCFIEDNKYLFWLIKKGRGFIELFNEEELIAYHNFFKIPYYRKLIFKENKILVNDRVDSKLEKIIRIYLDPNVEISKVGNNFIILNLVKSLIKVIFHNENLMIDKTKIAKEYGELTETNLIIVKTFNNEIKWEIEFDVTN